MADFVNGLLRGVSIGADRNPLAKLKKIIDFRTLSSLTGRVKVQSRFTGRNPRAWSNLRSLRISLIGKAQRTRGHPHQPGDFDVELGLWPAVRPQRF
jgi:hypothetical protein